MSDTGLNALASIVNRRGRLTRYQYYSPVLDFYDRWSELDPEVSGRRPALPPLCEAFAHDINNLAVYACELLRWSSPTELRRSEGVVAVGAISEAYITTLRSAADVVAGMAAYCASKKPGQAPGTSLHDLLVWAQKNPRRLEQGAASLLASDWKWFYGMRTIRDLLVHDGLRANIHTNRKAYRLWIYSPKRGWITRTPLFPLLGQWTMALHTFSTSTGILLAKHVALPKQRVRSRVLEGVFIPHLHRFLSRAQKPVPPDPYDI
jgi:hypothetical protein